MYFKISLAVSAFLVYTAFIGFGSYAPYNILRTVVCLYSAYSAYFWYEKSERFMWAFAIMAIMINPIFKVHFSRATWGMIDIIFAGIILFATWRLNSKKQ
jgi:ABC-type enterochelin transport system permease subunit